MIKIFRSITEAINYVLDNNLNAINIGLMEEKLMDRKVYKSKKYGLTFIIDSAGILG